MIFTHQHFIPSYGSAHINCTLYPVPLCRTMKLRTPLRKNFCSEKLQR